MVVLSRVLLDANCQSDWTIFQIVAFASVAVILQEISVKRFTCLTSVFLYTVGHLNLKVSFIQL